jgi:hypothetical protein
MRLLVGVAFCALTMVCLDCSDSDDQSDNTYIGPTNHCLTNDDCPLQTTCNIQSELCVSGANPAGRNYTVKVSPSQSTGVPSQMFRIELDESGEIGQPLVIVRPVEVSINVSSEVDGIQNQDIDARLLITDLSTSFPGLTTRIVSYNILDQKGTIRINLLPGAKRYQFKFSPLGATSEIFPPKYWDNLTVTVAGEIISEDGEPIDNFVLPAATTFATGVINRGSQFIDGLSVEAFDPATKRIVSTHTKTGCTGVDKMCGAFSIGLSPEIKTFSLRIYRPEQKWYPTTAIDNIEVPIIEDEDLKTFEIDIDTLDSLETPIRYHARVEKSVELSNGEIIKVGTPDCLVIFESDKIHAGGKAVQQAVTGSSGELEDGHDTSGVAFYPGSYEVTIIPPRPFSEDPNNHSVLRLPQPIDLSGTAEISGQVFLLSKLPLIKGRIWAGNNQVWTGTLVATPTLKTSKYVRSSSAKTEADGLFRLPVDLGEFRLTAQVSEQSGFAWGSTSIVAKEDIDLSIRVRYPMLANFDLVALDIDLNDAKIELYKDIQGRNYLVGRTESDSAGHVQALLSP